LQNPFSEEDLLQRLEIALDRSFAPKWLKSPTLEGKNRDDSKPSGTNSYDNMAAAEASAGVVGWTWRSMAAKNRDREGRHRADGAAPAWRAFLAGLSVHRRRRGVARLKDAGGLSTVFDITNVKAGSHSSPIRRTSASA
jgi:hypothetical protein